MLIMLQNMIGIRQVLRQVVELKLKYLNSSLEKEPLNYKSWEDKLILLSSMDKDAHSKAVKEMQEVFKDYPVIVKNLENK